MHCLLGDSLAFFQLFFCLHELVITSLLAFFAIIIKTTTLQLCTMMLNNRDLRVSEFRTTYVDVLELVVLKMRDWINKVVLNNIFKLILDIGKLTIRFRCINKRFAEIRFVAEAASIFDHAIGKKTLSLRV